jgi:hypothetical protein
MSQFRNVIKSCPITGPGIDLFLHYLVAVRHPVIPESDRQFTGGTGRSDVNQGQSGDPSRQMQGTTARYAHFFHGFTSLYGHTFAHIFLLVLISRYCDIRDGRKNLSSPLTGTSA